MVAESRGAYWGGLDIAPIMIAFFLLYVPPFFVHRSRKKASSIGTLSSLGNADGVRF